MIKSKYTILLIILFCKRKKMKEDEKMEEIKKILDNNYDEDEKEVEND